MAYIITVHLTHKQHTITLVTRRRLNITAALLEARLGFRSGEYKLLAEDGLFGPSVFGKEVVDERDLERTISWLKGLGFAGGKDGGLLGSKLQAADGKRL